MHQAGGEVDAEEGAEAGDLDWDFETSADVAHSLGVGARLIRRDPGRRRASSCSRVATPATVVTGLALKVPAWATRGASAGL